MVDRDVAGPINWNIFYDAATSLDRKRQTLREKMNTDSYSASSSQWNIRDENAVRKSKIERVGGQKVIPRTSPFNEGSSFARSNNDRILQSKMNRNEMNAYDLVKNRYLSTGIDIFDIDHQGFNFQFNTSSLTSAYDEVMLVQTSMAYRTDPILGSSSSSSFNLSSSSMSTLNQQQSLRLPVYLIANGDNVMRLVLSAYRSAMWCFWCRAGLRNNLKTTYPSPAWIDENSWLAWFWSVKSDVNKRQSDEVAHQIERKFMRELSTIMMINPKRIEKLLQDTLSEFRPLKPDLDLPSFSLKALTYTQFGSAESMWDLLIWMALNFADPPADTILMAHEKQTKTTPPFNPSRYSKKYAIPLQSSPYTLNNFSTFYTQPLHSRELDADHGVWIYNPTTRQWFIDPPHPSNTSIFSHQPKDNMMRDWTLSQDIVDQLYDAENIEDARFDLPVYKRGGFYLLLQAFTLMCHLVPSYQSLVGYFWPLPAQHAQNSSSLCQWLLTRQWQWFMIERNGNVMPLLNKLLPHYGDLYTSIKLNMEQGNNGLMQPDAQYLTVAEHVQRQALVKTHDTTHTSI